MKKILQNQLKPGMVFPNVTYCKTTLGEKIYTPAEGLPWAKIVAFPSGRTAVFLYNKEVTTPKMIPIHHLVSLVYDDKIPGKGEVRLSTAYHLNS